MANYSIRSPEILVSVTFHALQGGKLGYFGPFIHLLPNRIYQNIMHHPKLRDQYILTPGKQEDVHKIQPLPPTSILKARIMERTHNNSQLPPPSDITENTDPQCLWSDFYNKHYANTTTDHPPQQTAPPPPPNPPAPKLSFVDSIIQDHNTANNPPQTWIQPKKPIRHNLVTNMPPQPQNTSLNPFFILGVEPITNADEMEVEVVEQPTTLQLAPQRPDSPMPTYNQQACTKQQHQSGVSQSFKPCPLLCTN